MRRVLVQGGGEGPAGGGSIFQGARLSLASKSCSLNALGLCVEKHSKPSDVRSERSMCACRGLPDPPRPHPTGSGHSIGHVLGKAAKAQANLSTSKSEFRKSEFSP